MVSLLPTFSPSWNSHSGPTPHFINSFDIIQNLQASPILQTSFLPWTFFAISYSKAALILFFLFEEARQISCSFRFWFFGQRYQKTKISNLFVTSKNETTNSPIKASDPLKIPFKIASIRYPSAARRWGLRALRFTVRFGLLGLSPCPSQSGQSLVSQLLVHALVRVPTPK